MDVRIDEKGKYFTAHIAKDAVSAFVRTTDAIIVGSIYVRPGHRLTDELNGDSAPFLPITNARVYDANTEQLRYRAGLMLLAYREIVLVAELDALAELRPTAWQAPEEGYEPQPHAGDYSLRVDQKGKYFSLRVPKDALHTIAHTAGMVIAGYMYLRPDRRMKDELNESRLRFLPFTEARVFAVAGTEPLYHASFLLISYDRLAALSPAESFEPIGPAPWLISPEPEETA
jgi:hypothetical protein